MRKPQFIMTSLEQRNKTPLDIKTGMSMRTFRKNTKTFFVNNNCQIPVLSHEQVLSY